MKTFPALTRRKLMAGMAGWLGLLLLPAVSTVSRRSAPSSAEDIAFDLARLFSQNGGSRSIGREYLKIRPQEANRDLLVQLVFADDPDAQSSICHWPNLVQRAYFARRCREDFANGRTAVVGNWILSETEARLSALSSLLPA